MCRTRFAAILVASLATLSLVSCAETATRESTGQYVDDGTITAKVKTALVEDQSLKGFQIGVETYKNVVQLSGFVDTPQEAERAQEVAANVSGVRSVRNGLVVK
jgi:osmotically-inducible protein OsmY